MRVCVKERWLGVEASAASCAAKVMRDSRCAKGMCVCTCMRVFVYVCLCVFACVFVFVCVPLTLTYVVAAVSKITSHIWPVRIKTADARLGSGSGSGSGSG